MICQAEITAEQCFFHMGKAQLNLSLAIMFSSLDSNPRSAAHVVGLSRASSLEIQPLQLFMHVESLAVVIVLLQILGLYWFNMYCISELHTARS